VRDGGAPPGADVPVYAVEAVQAGRSSAAVRSGAPAAAPPRPVAPAEPGEPAEPGAPPGPAAVRAERGAGGSVVVAWTGPPGAEFRVRCRMPDGRWRVVGRTREHRIEDGGAPDGPVPEYTVSAAVDGARSAEVATG
jgi:hypothetical protein